MNTPRPNTPRTNDPRTNDHAQRSGAALRSGWPAAVAAGVVVALLSLTGLVHPPAAAPPSPVPVVGRSLQVCPFPTRTAGSAAVDTVPLALAIPDAATAGQAELAPLGSDDASASVDAPGTVTALTQTATLRLDTSGGFAGATATALLKATKGADRGDSALTCVRPATQLWFPAAGAGDVATTRIVLANPDATDAVVDLHALGPHGPLAMPGALGLVVPRHGTREVALTGLLPSGLTGAISLQVSAASGRVAAVAHTTYQSDRRAAGADWTLGQPAPRTELVIPGVPGGKGSRKLVIGNPGTSRATVHITALGKAGPFAPAGADSVEVEPSSTATVRLDAALDGEAVSLQLASTTAVVASVVSASTRTGAAADVAVQQPADALAAAGPTNSGIAALPAAPGLAGTLLLSNAGSADTEVHVRLRDAAGTTLFDKSVPLPAGASATVSVPAAASARAVQVDTPGTRVYAAVVLTRAGGDVAGLTTVVLTSGAATESRVEATMGRGAGW